MYNQLTLVCIHIVALKETLLLKLVITLCILLVNSVLFSLVPSQTPTTTTTIRMKIMTIMGDLAHRCTGGGEEEVSLQ